MPSPRVALSAMAAAALAAGCAHAPRPSVSRPAAALRCEEAGRIVAARARTSRLDDLRRSATHPASLLLTGAGWVTDGAVVVGAGATMGGAVCVPIFALEASLNGSGAASGECFVRATAMFIDATPSPGVGRGVWNATRSWRCPDFVQLAREVRAVSACYAARAGPGDVDLAAAHLVQLRNDRGVWECLPAGERGAVEEALQRVGWGPRPPWAPAPPGP